MGIISDAAKSRAKALEDVIGTSKGHKIYGIDKLIHGAPPRWSKSCDPGGEVYNELLLSGASICNIVPGKPAFSSTSLGEKKRELALSRLNLDQSRESDSSGMYNDSDLNALGRPENSYEDHNPLTSTISSQLDLRLVGFRSAWAEWRRYCNPMLNLVFSILSGVSIGKSITGFVDSSDIYLSGGIHYWLQPSGAINDSFSNELGTSKLASFTQGISDMAREMNFLIGTKDGREVGTGDTTWGSGDGKENSGGVLNTVRDAASGIAGFLSSSGQQLILGENIIYPKNWKSSSNNTPVNLSILLRSPSGSSEDILNYVLAPMIALLPMVQPIQLTPNSHAAPMLCRVESPGQFVIDVGMITNMVITNGGPSKLYSKNCLPRELGIELTVQSLYPVMTAPSDVNILEGSIGTSAWLRAKTGLLPVTRANVREELRSMFLSRIANIADVRGMVAAYGGNFLNKAMDSIWQR